MQLYEGNMKYQVGQKVTVRHDLEQRRYYSSENDSHNFVMPEMYDLRGREVTIEGYNDSQYYIVEGRYRWVDAMFEEPNDEVALVDIGAASEAFEALMGASR